MRLSTIGVPDRCFSRAREVVAADTSGSATVVNTLRRRRLTPSISMACMSLATWSRPISCPARRAAFQSLCAP